MISYGVGLLANHPSSDNAHIKDFNQENPIKKRNKKDKLNRILMQHFDVKAPIAMMMIRKSLILLLPIGIDNLALI